MKGGETASKKQGQNICEKNRNSYRWFAALPQLLALGLPLLVDPVALLHLLLVSLPGTAQKR